MIEIIVRHSHQQQQQQQQQQRSSTNSTNLASSDKRPDREQEQERSGGSSAKKKRVKGAIQIGETSSVIEIKYSKMSAPIAAPSAAPRASSKSFKAAGARQAPARKVGVTAAASGSGQQRPRGSLSSCSSSSPELSGNEEAACEYYCNHYAGQTGANRGQNYYSLSVFDESGLSGDDELEVQLQPKDLNNNHLNQGGQTSKNFEGQQAPVAASRRNLRTNLHSRSISLIVNPDFLTEASSESEAEPEALQPAVANLAKYKRGRHNRFHHQRQASQCALTRDNFREADLVKFRQLKEELEAGKLLEDKRRQEEAAAATERLDEDENVRLRQIGFFLRQVSDEFAMNRRLTI